MKLLLVDIGNTSVKASCYDGRLYTAYSPRRYSQYINAEAALADLIAESVVAKALSAVVFCSVVPDVTRVLKKQLEAHGVSLLQFTSDKQQRLALNYKAPGDDRVLAAYAASLLYPKKTLMVVDAGTAVTLDLVLRGELFEGGYIVPGLDAARRSLFNETSFADEALMQQKSAHLLELGDLPQVPLAHSTKEAVNWGLAALYKGGVSSIYNSFRTISREDVGVLVTGGDAELFMSFLSEYKPIQENGLLAQGLAAFYSESRGC